MDTLLPKNVVIILLKKINVPIPVTSGGFERDKGVICEEAKSHVENKLSGKRGDVGTCSLSKKEFGDEIKAALRLERYEVQRTRI